MNDLLADGLPPKELSVAIAVSTSRNTPTARARADPHVQEVSAAVEDRRRNQPGPVNVVNVQFSQIVPQLSVATTPK